MPAIGHIPLSSLDSNDIQVLYNKLQTAGKAPATIHKIHQIIHSCLEKAVEKRLLVWNPSNATEKPSVKTKREAQAMSKADMDNFLDVIYKETPKWKAAFLTLLGTGLRIGELLALEWKDVDLEKGIINVRHTISRTQSKGLIIEDPKQKSQKHPYQFPMKH